MHAGVSKKEWVAIFQEIGLTEPSMMKWHQLFEARHPEGHEAFLSWLGIPKSEIAGIRAKSRQAD